MIDEELRRAAAEATRGITGESLPPLRLPRRRTPRSGWAVPAGAAAAVLAVITAAFLLVPGSRPAPPVTRDGVPRFFAALTFSGRAGVYDAATGRRTATIAPGPSGYTAVAAAADRRTYYLSAPGAACSSVVVAVRIDGRGAVVSRTRAGTVPVRNVSGLAVSPDGRRLAATGTGCGRARIGVTDLRTGPRRPLVLPSGHGVVDDPAFTADGRTLLYCLRPEPAGLPCRPRALDPARATDLGGARTVPLAAPSGEHVVTVAPGRDAGTVVAVSRRFAGSGAYRYTVSTYDRATGGRVARIMAFAFRGPDILTFAFAPSPRHLLAANEHALVRVDGGRSTPLGLLPRPAW